MTLPDIVLDAQEQLDWPLLLDALKPFAETFFAQKQIANNQLFLSSLATIQHHLNAVSDVRQMIERAGDVTLSSFADPTPSLQRIAKQGSLYSTAELLELSVALHEIQKLLSYFSKNLSLTKQMGLQHFLPDATQIRMVLDILDDVIEPVAGARIKDTASTQYASLLRQHQQIQTDLEERLSTYLRNTTIQTALQENFWRIREGRYLLSVKADNKSQIAGLVIDTSASENTVFVAPDVVRKENQLLLAKQAELDAEIQRILETLSRKLEPECEGLFSLLNTTSVLDVILTKARFSLRLDASYFSLVDGKQKTVQLVEARHPLLIMQNTTVVPNTITIESETRVLLISGPNTGGKTVVLKTLGLLQLMARCGMHLPVAEQSSMSLFEYLLVDIGDTQNLNQNLSTFSGHLTHIRQFFDVKQLDNALVLIDEIGAGTDPVEAVVLAEEILKLLVLRQATCVVTTHLNELKRLAYQTTGFQNACVAFDVETLSPTYKLLIGSAGQSHALTIAKKLGLPGEIIDRAEALLKNRQTPTDELLNQLEIKQAEILLNEHKISQLLKEVQAEKQDLQTQFNRIEGEKQKILEQFRDKLRSQFEPVENQLDLIKKAFKEKRLSPSRVRFQAKHLSTAKETVNTVVETELEKLYPNAMVAWVDINIGDTVRSKKMNFQGKVLEKHEHNQTLLVQSGLLKTTVSHADIIAHFKASQPVPRPKLKTKHTASETLMSLKRECDVRGLNSDDAMNILEKVLDDAMLENIGVVECIHGEGTGALKKNIRKALSELHYVKKYYPAQGIDGGDGKTIIELK